MALYSPGRRRAIILLVLTSALLLTLDLRGNAILDGARSAWSGVLRPLESATEVVTRPVENAWRGITSYDELEERADRLQAENDLLRANNFVASAFLGQLRDVRRQLALPLPGDYPLIGGIVEGPGPTNVDQTIQISVGTDDNVCVGMPVLSSNWLIGRVTRVGADRAWVRLITDSQYRISAKAVRPETIDPEELPIGLTPVTTTVPPTAPPVTALPLDTLTPPDPASSVPPGSDPAAIETTTTTTLPPPDPVRITGIFEGRGADEHPVMVISENPTAENRPQPGDVVFTTGGELSLAPLDLPIGVVSSSAQGATSQGWVAEVDPVVNLDNVEFVSVMLYVSEQEAPACDGVATS